MPAVQGVLILSVAQYFNKKTDTQCSGPQQRSVVLGLRSHGFCSGPAADWIEF